MERLTKRISAGIQLERRESNGKMEYCGVDYNAPYLVQAARERLAAYEDTGLTPEELMSLKENGVIPKHWSELFLAEADGRLVVLPCKVGDTVYMTHRVFGQTSISEEHFRLEYFEYIGETVFITREEAEATLGEAER